MNSPAQGLALHFWLRHRTGLCLYATYFLVAMLAYRLPDVPGRLLLLITIYAPFAVGLFYLIGVFTNVDMDLHATRSNYPAYLFTLPVPTRALAFWPILYGAVTLSLVWLLFGVTVLVPLGHAAYLWWPAACLAALVATLQAISWYPVPLPHLRTILVVAVTPGLIFLGMFARSQGWEIGAIILYLCLTVVCALVANRGLTLARSGVSEEGRWLPERPQSEAISLRPFSSPLMAQTWLEWKRNGLILPMVAFSMNLLDFVPLFAAASKDASWVPLGVGDIEFHQESIIFLFIPVCLTLFAGAIGCSPRKGDTFRPDMSLQPFFAARPLTDVQLIAAKLLSAAGSALVTGGVQSLFLIAWLLFPARQGGHTGSLFLLALPYLPAYWPLLVLPLLALCTLSLWTSMVSSLWLELYGRRWITDTFGVVFTMAFTWIGLMGAVWSPSHPQETMALLKVLPTVFRIALALKVAVAAWGLSQLYRRRLVSARLVAGILGTWLVVACGVFLLLWTQLPKGWISVMDLAVAVALFTPIARLSLAPLSLHANRHR